MTDRWRVAADQKADEFLDEVQAELQRLFGISAAEARYRIDQGWSHLPDRSIGGPEEIAYHEEPYYWAHHFYYGKDSFWWIVGPERTRLGHPPLTPIPIGDAPGSGT
jgi:hypothetical protein